MIIFSKSGGSFFLSLSLSKLIFVYQPEYLNIFSILEKNKGSFEPASILVTRGITDKAKLDGVINADLYQNIHISSVSCPEVSKAISKEEMEFCLLVQQILLLKRYLEWIPIFE